MVEEEGDWDTVGVAFIVGGGVVGVFVAGEVLVVVVVVAGEVLVVVVAVARCFFRRSLSFFCRISCSCLISWRRFVVVILLLLLLILLLLLLSLCLLLSLTLLELLSLVLVRKVGIFVFVGVNVGASDDRVMQGAFLPRRYTLSGLCCRGTKSASLPYLADHCMVSLVSLSLLKTRAAVSVAEYVTGAVSSAVSFVVSLVSLLLVEIRAAVSVAECDVNRLIEVDDMVVSVVSSAVVFCHQHWFTHSLCCILFAAGAA